VKYHPATLLRETVWFEIHSVLTNNISSEAGLAEGKFLLQQSENIETAVIYRAGKGRPTVSKEDRV
jgi:hypothetical protein